jgi:hypothetical protein
MSETVANVVLSMVVMFALAYSAHGFGKFGERRRWIEWLRTQEPRVGLSGLEDLERRTKR